MEKLTLDDIMDMDSTELQEYLVENHGYSWGQLEDWDTNELREKIREMEGV